MLNPEQLPEAYPTVQPSVAPLVPVLEIRDVVKRYRTDVFKKPVLAVDGLSLRFDAGQCTGLLGHNGAGKTTTIRMILGLIRPDRGQILFHGAPLTWRHKARIGYMPEVNKLPLALTPEEILRFQLALFNPRGLARALRPEAIAAKLHEVGLYQHRRKKVGQLSKGLGRRLAWAQATIHQPELVILDEPFSGMDPLGCRAMEGWIAALAAKGTTVVLCAHELNAIQNLCGNLYLMRQGRLAYQQTLARDLPCHSLKLSGASLDMLSTMQRQEGLPAWQDVAQDGYLSTLRFTTYNDAARWLGAVQHAGCVIIHFGAEPALNKNALLAYFEGR